MTGRLDPAGRGVRNTLNRDHFSSRSGTFHGRKSEISDLRGEARGQAFFGIMRQLHFLAEAEPVPAGIRGLGDPDP